MFTLTTFILLVTTWPTLEEKKLESMFLKKDKIVKKLLKPF